MNVPITTIRKHQIYNDQLTYGYRFVTNGHKIDSELYIFKKSYDVSYIYVKH